MAATSYDEALAAIERVALATQTDAHPAELLAGVCAATVEVLGLERVALARSGRRGGIRLVASAGGELARPLEEEAAAEAATTGEPVHADPDRTRVVVPLPAPEELLGFLVCEREDDPIELDDTTRALLRALGAVVAGALDRAERRAEALALSEAKTEFVALAAHELRTPVTIVAGAAETLRRPDIDAADRQELEDALLASARRLARLAEQLLELSRLDAATIRIRPARIAVADELRSVVATVAGERAAEVDLDVPPGLEAPADRVALARIVAHLLSNALRYGDPPVRVRARGRDGKLEVEVEDAGRGVDPAFHARLFQTFSRSEDSRGAFPSGAGLGLAVARAYALAHGGELEYEEAEPRGARFRAVLASDA